ncbi:MAG: DUF4249 family protein [Bacteroidia bacterium]
MYRKMLWVLYFIAGLFLISCREDITLDVPPYENKLAVFCVLQPDTVPILFLNRSKSYFDYTDKSYEIQDIKNAKVIITDLTNGKKDTLRSRFGSWVSVRINNMFISGYLPHYIGKIKPQIWHKYLLEIWHKDKYVSAETFIPKPVEISAITFTVDSMEFYRGYVSGYNFNITFKDELSAANGYNALIRYSNGNGVAANDRNVAFKFDYGKDGQPITLNYYQDIHHQNSDSLAYNFIIENNTAETAEYIQSVIKQVSMGEEDILSEPVIVKHNIKGGLGIFGASTKSKPFRIKVK